MEPHDVNSEYVKRAGDLAFSFDEQAKKPLQILDARDKVLVEMDIHQSQKLYELLYRKHYKIVELLEKARSQK